MAKAIHLLYADFPVLDENSFADFHVRLTRPANLRRWFHPQVFFSMDEERPFAPLPLSHAYAMFEWCFNWCIETYAHQYLMIHAAILERGGHAVIMAAPPGSGKSTLTAGLTMRGWRLLSDELTLLDPDDGLATPLARPIALKNKSIEVIQEFSPGAILGPLAFETVKGTVAHLKPSRESVERVHERAQPRWVIFPKYEAGSAAALTPYPKSEALLRLGDNAFNYSHLRERGFRVLTDLVDRCGCYEFTYSRLEDAAGIFASLSSTVDVGACP